MNFDNSQPIYLQIIEEHKKRIVRGELKKGDKIPSQREYAQIARVNPNTVQRAYREMEILKIVETLRGQGTFVTADELMREQMKKEMAGNLINNFIAEMKSLGYKNQEITDAIVKGLLVMEEGERVDRI